MKAVVYHQYGGPEVLRMTEVATPVPKADEVLIRIHATTVTAGDWRMRSLNLPRGFGLISRLAIGVTGPRKPILGTELSGVIAAVGAKVTKFKPMIYSGTLLNNRAISRFPEFLACAASGVPFRSTASRNAGNRVTYRSTQRSSPEATACTASSISMPSSPPRSRRYSIAHPAGVAWNRRSRALMSAPASRSIVTISRSPLSAA